MLVTGEVYHIFTRSIAGFKIFNNDSEFLRIIEALRFYQREKQSISLSKYNKLQAKVETLHFDVDMHRGRNEYLVDIIAFCIMPTHLHLILKQLKDNGITGFMGNLLNSYSRYFNIKHNRKGPLWEGRFKKVLVENDEYLLHLTRYLHLNPVTAGLVDSPMDWQASSFQEYISGANIKNKLCSFGDLLDITPLVYKKFVEDRISYQRELAKIKDLLLE
jgi:putative transposase